MKKKIALIFGIIGQDGSYLIELLLKKGYEVHGVKRRSSSLNTQRIDEIYNEHNEKNFFLHYGDITDSLMIQRLINSIRPHEIYNLAAQFSDGIVLENEYKNQDILDLASSKDVPLLQPEEDSEYYDYYESFFSEELV